MSTISGWQANNTQHLIRHGQLCLWPKTSSPVLKYSKSRGDHSGNQEFLLARNHRRKNAVALCPTRTPYETLSSSRKMATHQIQNLWSSPKTHSVNLLYNINYHNNNHTQKQAKHIDHILTGIGSLAKLQYITMDVCVGTFTSFWTKQIYLI